MRACGESAQLYNLTVMDAILLRLSSQLIHRPLKSVSEQLSAPKRDIYSISRLNKEVNLLLSASFPLLWIEGEISNFSQPRSGHMYFSLKDNAAQVRAAMFRNNNLYLRFQPESGMQVLVRARVALYEPRGDFQLIIEHMEEAGDGALRREFERLQQKLHNEGLFAEENKAPLPPFPKRLGIITSPTGAAIRDVLSILRRRYPKLEILIYPVAVQGESSAKEITQALQLAEKRADCDVLLLTRGGGSLEDLQAFNSETVARTVAASSIPIVSGVGHEIDYTITDLVADVRAATPSAAAEIISPDASQLMQHIAHLHNALQTTIKSHIYGHYDQFQQLQNRLDRQHPRQRLHIQSQRLDDLEIRLQQSIQVSVRQAVNRLDSAKLMLFAHSPLSQIQQLTKHTTQLRHELQRALYTFLQGRKHYLTTLFRNLDAVSPLNTLKRGYAIVTKPGATRPIVSTGKLEIDEKLDVRLADGQLGVKVKKLG